MHHRLSSYKSIQAGRCCLGILASMLADDTVAPIRRPVILPLFQHFTTSVPRQELKQKKVGRRGHNYEADDPQDNQKKSRNYLNSQEYYGVETPKRHIQRKGDSEIHRRIRRYNTGDTNSYDGNSWIKHSNQKKFKHVTNTFEEAKGHGEVFEVVDIVKSEARQESYPIIMTSHRTPFVSGHTPKTEMPHKDKNLLCKQLSTFIPLW